MYKTQGRPMSSSSDGSITADMPPESRGRNPFVKAISSQRKDFNFVTMVRKEVINIVEPFRHKIRKFEKRLAYLERYTIE